MPRFVRPAVFMPMALAALLAAGCAAPSPTSIAPASVTPPMADPAPAAQAPAPVAPAAQDAGVELVGAAMLDDKPFGNAALSLFDLSTGQRVDGSRLTGETHTDADGRISLRLSGVRPGQVYRLMAALNADSALAATFMVTETGVRFLGVRSSKAYRVSSLPAESQAFLDENSSTITKLYVSGGTSAIDDATVTAAETAPESVDEYAALTAWFDSLDGAIEEVARQIDAKPSIGYQVVANFDVASGGYKSMSLSESLAAEAISRKTMVSAFKAYLLNLIKDGSISEPVSFTMTGLNGSATITPDGIKITTNGTTKPIEDPTAFDAKKTSHSHDHATAPAPTLTALSPATGDTAGGATVTLTGTDFTGATAVTFGDTPATDFDVVSATEITATAPAHAAGPVDVTVTAPGGTATSATPYTYVPAAAIASFMPATSSTAGGVSVTITGTNFTHASAVKFGGTAATAFHVDSATQITATAPAHAGGNVGVEVTTPAGTVFSEGSYFYEAALTISGLSSPSLPPGLPDTINGTGFTGATEVLFGTVPAVFQVTSDSTIDVTVPAGVDGLVSVTVTTPRDSKTLADAFTGLPDPGGMPGGDPLDPPGGIPGGP